jgi:hypothetical protein
MYPARGAELSIFGANDIPLLNSIESNFIKNGAFYCC